MAAFPTPRQVVNPALGSDLSCVRDLTAQMAEVSGRRCLAEALARRLITPRGALFYDKNYGYDVTAFLGADVSPQDVHRIEASVTAEFQKDERVTSASVRAQFVAPTQVDAARSGIVSNPLPGTAGVLVLSATITDAQGPFKLVLAATAVTVEILEVAA